MLENIILIYFNLINDLKIDTNTYGTIIKNINSYPKKKKIKSVTKIKK